MGEQERTAVEGFREEEEEEEGGGGRIHRNQENGENGV